MKNLEKYKKMLNQREENGQLTIYKMYGTKKGSLLYSYLYISTHKLRTKEYLRNLTRWIDATRDEQKEI